MTRTIEHLDRLVAFPSVSSDSNLPILDYIASVLSGCGAAVHRVADATGAKAGLFASIGPAGPGGVMLSGHTDVVPVAEQDWSADPFRLRRSGDRVYGRGTTDMKGFLAAMLSAAERAARASLAAPLKLAFSWDEEVGCLGIPQMLPALDAAIGRPQLCIVGEPTQMQIAVGHKGKVALRAICHGQAGHSAMAPDFVNAIHLAADFVARLRTLQRDLARDGVREDGYDIPYATVHAGRIAGGTALNIVPDRAVVDFEFRYPATQSAKAVHAAIDAAAEAAAAPFRAAFPGARIEVETVNAYPGLGLTGDAGTLDLMRGLVPGAAITKIACGTEAGHFAAAGIASVVCGPGSMEQGHKPDEFIALDQLAACDAMCDRLIAVLAAGNL
ncbi:acetylornithine deacetylase [Albidovulum sediminicola]|uniref:Acetylornithine deacetylase n=1 Tax=Albidovulum sediminicola TaxID=2984331 RepID=A0ABT2YXY8_9RHOB|nr:acetylornithine deacetylase [Defluviimonas sp. WL0075]MCV2863747.1 acetylornithine deacetylase [Defluviimonas sp. WL0075]